jgi:hypothetical protein
LNNPVEMYLWLTALKECIVSPAFAGHDLIVFLKTFRAKVFPTPAYSLRSADTVHDSRCNLISTNDNRSRDPPTSHPFPKHVVYSHPFLQASGQNWNYRRQSRSV